MQGFRNYNLEAMQREQLHVVDLMPPHYGKSTPPMSPNSGKFPRLVWLCRPFLRRRKRSNLNPELSCNIARRQQSFVRKHVSVLYNKAWAFLPKCFTNGIMIYGKLKAETTWTCLTRSGPESNEKLFKHVPGNVSSAVFLDYALLSSLVLLISKELYTRKVFK